MAESDRPGTAFANLAVVRVSVTGGQEACGISLASDAVEASNPSTKALSDKVDLARGGGERETSSAIDCHRRLRPYRLLPRLKRPSTFGGMPWAGSGRKVSKRVGLHGQ